MGQRTFQGYEPPESGDDEAGLSLWAIVRSDEKLSGGGAEAVVA